MPVTLKDIAHRANVSKQAVSAVLRGRSSTVRVSPALRERILDTAEEMGYRPNLLARALAEKRTGLFVTTCDRLWDPHYAEAILAVGDEARSAGFTTCVLHPEAAQPEADLLLYQMADAVLHLISLDLAEKILRVSADLAPSVMISGPTRFDVPIPQYYWDETEGARDVAAHLRELGHRDVAILAGAPAAEKGYLWERVRALAGTLEAEGVRAFPIWDDQETNPVTMGSAQLMRALTEHPAVTAVIGRNDRLTTGAYLECQRRGIAIPDRISLVAYVDTTFLNTVAPLLTAVRFPLRDAASEAARALIRHVREGTPLEMNRAWRPTLQIRASTARIPTKGDGA